MAKKGFQKEQKIGIVAIICLLIGSLFAFVFMYLNGNKIVVMQKEDNAVYNKKQKSYKAKTFNKKKYSNNYAFDKNNKSVNKNFKLRGVYNNQAIQDNNTTKEYAYSYVRKKENIILDLNNCDTLDLQMIRGIGPSYSRRIYKYREKLGGYVSVAQLKEVYGMTDSLYKHIEKHFKISQSNIRKVNINSENIKEIAVHPYIDWYLAKEIIIFHKKHGEYKDINELKAIHLMDETLFNKIKPYIALQ